MFVSGVPLGFGAGFAVGTFYMRRVWRRHLRALVRPAKDADFEIEPFV